MSATPAVRMEGSGFADYDDASQDHSYIHDGGVIAVPLASRSPAFRLIRLHGGIGFRKTAFSYARKGRPPIIPAATNTSGDTLLSSVVTPSLPTPDPVNSGYNWRVEGEYTYVQTTPRKAGYDALPVGNYPFPVFPTMNIAGAYAAPFQVLYTGPTGFHDFIEAVANNLQFSENQYSWPFLGLPTVFSSTHLIQD